MGERTRILVVDDEEGIRKVLATILEGEGYSVDTAKDGAEAIRRTKTKFYNLALLDFRLPDIEGTALLAKMRDTTPKMRKKIITGYPTLQNTMDALNRGANAYVLKPFDVEKLLLVVKEQLRKQEEERTYSQGRVTEFIETRVRELEEEKQ